MDGAEITMAQKFALGRGTRLVQYARVPIAVLISCIAFWLAVRQIPLKGFIASLSLVHPAPIVAAVVFLALAMWAKVERWCCILRKHAGVSRTTLWHALMVGYLGNVILPGRMGELVRAYLAAEHSAVSVAEVLSTLIVEKVLDIGTLLFIWFIVSMHFSLPPGITRAGMLSGFVFFLLSISIAFVVVFTRETRWLLSYLQSHLPEGYVGRQGYRWANAFVDGFCELRSPSILLRLIMWSVLIWLLGGLVNLCVLWSFGIEPLIPASGLTLVVTNIGMLVPAAPGYIGVHHYLSVLALEVFGTESDISLAYAVVVHAVIFGFFAVVGCVALVVSGNSLKVFSRTPMSSNVN